MALGGDNFNISLVTILLAFLLSETGEPSSMAHCNLISTVPPSNVTKMLEQSWEKDPLLSPSVIPQHYELFLDPHIGEGVFYGRVNITLNITSPTSAIILHTKLLNVTSTQLFNAELSAISIRDAFEYKPNEFWITKLEHQVPVGKYFLKLNFSGSLTNGIVGFYRSTYSKPNGEFSSIVSTKFEPTYARRAFPCFDEPSYKATFDIKLVRPSGSSYIALSNMNQISEEEDYPTMGRTTVKFMTTPPMSTYLACFIVCDFSRLPPTFTNSSKTAVSVYARDGQLENAKIAQDLAVAVLDHFTDYFGIEFPLPKLDLIAVPDFVSGAMENWGLITFRESRMLGNSESSAVQDLIGMMNTVTHELAHMWFGDLVTMGWWDDLWLNEGFATFLATSALNKLYPKHQAQPHFLVSTLHLVLVDDAAVSSHPIIQHVKHPDQITEMFDSISYGKGSSVLRMIENYEPNGFQRAVSRYLERYKYKNAKTSDLWAELSTEYKSVEDLRRMLDSWTKQMGYPLVRAERVGHELIFEQTRCLSYSKGEFDKDSSPFKYKWDIPIKYVTSRNPTSPQSVVLKLDEKSVKVSLPEAVTWFKVNFEQVGFYRVNYTDKEWEVLLNVLRHERNSLTPEDRANLLDDAFILAKSGYLGYSIPLELMTYIQEGETHWAPWSVLAGHLLAIKRAYSTDSPFDELKGYVTQLVKGMITNETFWEFKSEHSFEERLLKGVVVRFACAVGVDEALARVNKFFTDWIQGGAKPPIDIRKSVYKFGIYGKRIETHWNDLWELYLVEQEPHEKEMMLEALASVEEPSIINKLLESMKNESLVRSQDYFTFMFNIARSSEGNEIVWDYVRNNWSYLVKRFTLNHRMFGRVLPVLARLFYTEKRLQEITDFIKTNPEAGAGAAGRRTAIEVTKWNIIWKGILNQANIPETLLRLTKI